MLHLEPLKLNADPQETTSELVLIHLPTLCAHERGMAGGGDFDRHDLVSFILHSNIKALHLLSHDQSSKRKFGGCQMPYEESNNTHGSRNRQQRAGETEKDGRRETSEEEQKGAKEEEKEKEKKEVREGGAGGGGGGGRGGGSFELMECDIGEDVLPDLECSHALAFRWQESKLLSIAIHHHHACK